MRSRWFSLVMVLLFVWALAYGVHERKEALRAQHIYQPLKTISKQNFKNQIVPLDGNKYSECTFESVTFRWHGAPYQFDRVHITGNRNIEVDGDVADVVYFLAALDLLNPQLNETLHKLKN